MDLNDLGILAYDGFGGFGSSSIFGRYGFFYSYFFTFLKQWHRSNNGQNNGQKYG